MVLPRSPAFLRQLVERRALLKVLSIAMLAAALFVTWKLVSVLFVAAEGSMTSDAPIYFAMGRGLLNGFHLYTDLFESKPPGIFLLSALSLVVTGDERFLLALQLALYFAIPVSGLWFALSQSRTSRWETLLLAGSSAFGVAALLTLYLIERSEPLQTESIGAVFASGYVLAENRLVVRDLEQRWETALRAQRTLEEDYDRFCLDQPPVLSSQEKERIRELSSVVPSIWNAPETTPQDRKLIVRQLIERVIVRRNGEIADVTIHWAGGYVSAHQIAQPVGSYRRLRDFERFKERVLELHWAGRTYSEICAQLIEEHFPSPKGTNLFRPENIRMFLERYCSQELGPDWGSFREYLRPDEWLIGDLSRELDIPQATLQYWRRRGWLHGRQLRPGGGRWIFWADRDELKRLRKLRACPINHNAKELPYPEELMTPKPRPHPVTILIGLPGLAVGECSVV